MECQLWSWGTDPASAGVEETSSDFISLFLTPLVTDVGILKRTRTDLAPSQVLEVVELGLVVSSQPGGLRDPRAPPRHADGMSRGWRRARPREVLHERLTKINE